MFMFYWDISTREGRVVITITEIDVVFLSLQSDGYPTLLFFPAGNKSFEPVSKKFKEIQI